MRRADYGADADAYFDGLDADLRATARSVRKLILDAAPGLVESIKWGVPVYERAGLVCAIRCTKSSVALQLHHGDLRLHDPQGLLEGTGTTMRHVKVRTPGDINRDLFTAWIRQIASRTA